LSYQKQQRRQKNKVPQEAVAGTKKPKISTLLNVPDKITVELTFYRKSQLYSHFVWYIENEFSNVKI